MKLMKILLTCEFVDPAKRSKSSNACALANSNGVSDEVPQSFKKMVVRHYINYISRPLLICISLRIG